MLDSLQNKKKDFFQNFFESYIDASMQYSSIC